MIKAILSDFYRVLYLPENPSPLNFKLLKLYTDLKQKHKIKLYIFTNSRLTSLYYQKNLNIFEKIFSSNPFTFSKKNPDSYLKIAAEINILPKEILFIDDQETNLKAAEKAKLATILFINNIRFINNLKNNHYRVIL